MTRDNRSSPSVGAKAQKKQLDRRGTLLRLRAHEPAGPPPGFEPKLVSSSKRSRTAGNAKRASAERTTLRTARRGRSLSRQDSAPRLAPHHHLLCVPVQQANCALPTSRSILSRGWAPRGFPPNATGAWLARNGLIWRRLLVADRAFGLRRPMGRLFAGAGLAAWA